MNTADHGSVADASTAELIGRASEDIATLVRDEIALAKDDLARTGRRTAVGAGMFGVAGILALGGFGALVAAAVLGAAEALDGWLAALVVAAVLFVVAGIAALVGRTGISAISHAPKERVSSVQQDVRAASPTKEEAP